MPSSITLTSSAYSLLLLHAAAHPQSTVTGFLLANTNTQGGQDQQPLLVEKVVPLAHHWTTLALTEDVGIEILTSHLASTSSPLSIVGLYEAPAKANATVLSHSALRLANKISQRIVEGKGKGKESGAGPTTAGGNACLALLLQNSSILSPPSHSLQPFFIPPSSSAQLFDQGKLSVQGGEETIRRLVEVVRIENAWKEVRDLDDHLEDTSVDWLENSLVSGKLVVAKS